MFNLLAPPRVEEPQISPSMSNEDQKEAEKLTNYIQAEFPDVFREKLGREDWMAFDPAELIVVNEDVEPHYRGWAKDVPAHYLDESKQLINDLLEGGIITEVTKPVQWCT